MPEHILVGLSSIIILGVLAQWLAWRFRLPAILLLFIFGFIAGPVTGILDPDEVFGDLFFPLISISVAIILFEGGMRLRLSELKEAGPVVFRLTSLGIIITWVLAAAGLYFVVGMSRHLSILLGAVLVVTGPTVIIPLLRQVRPIGKYAAIVKWEGIVNDPIGAILAVLVFEIIVPRTSSVSSILAEGVLKSLGLGSLIGVVGAVVIVLMLRKYLVPDFLQTPITTMLVVIVFITANFIQSESGLLAVTVMGIVLAGQRFVSIKHIVDFKENLQVLLIASLFIMLAARIPVADLGLTNWAEWAFVALIILVIRPLAVLGSTLWSDIDKAGKVFLSCMAPRGVVAAAVVSVFALRLEDTGIEGVDRLVPLTFKVIFATVAIYGLTAPWLARRLKIAKPNPQGVLFGGAQLWVQEVALALKAEGLETVLVDANWANITTARGKGLRAHYGSLLSEDVFNRVPLDEIGMFVAVTPNDEVNSLAAIHFGDILGRASVYQLPPSDNKGKDGRESNMPLHLRGRPVFAGHATHDYIKDFFQRGGVVKRTSISAEFDLDRYSSTYGEEALQLFLVSTDGFLRPITVKDPPIAKAGDKLVGIVRRPALQVSPDKTTSV